MMRVLILRHDVLAEPALEMLRILASGLSKSEIGAKLLSVTAPTTAFQGVVKPRDGRHLKLFGHIIDGG